MHLVASVRPSVCPFVCLRALSCLTRLIIGAAKSIQSHYQFKVFVCVSVISGPVRIIARMRSISILIHVWSQNSLSMQLLLALTYDYVSPPPWQNWGILQVKLEFSIQNWGKLQVKLEFCQVGMIKKSPSKQLWDCDR